MKMAELIHQSVNKPIAQPPGALDVENSRPHHRNQREKRFGSNEINWKSRLWVSL